MTGPYATTVTVVALLPAAWALISAAANRPRGFVGHVLGALAIPPFAFYWASADS